MTTPGTGPPVSDSWSLGLHTCLVRKAPWQRKATEDGSSTAAAANVALHRPQAPLLACHPCLSSPDRHNTDRHGRGHHALAPHPFTSRRGTNRRAGRHPSRPVPWAWPAMSTSHTATPRRGSSSPNNSIYVSVLCLVPTLTDHTHVFITEQEKIQTFIPPRTCSKEPPWILSQSYC